MELVFSDIIISKKSVFFFICLISMKHDLLKCPSLRTDSKIKFIQFKFFVMSSSQRVNASEEDIKLRAGNNVQKVKWPGSCTVLFYFT